MGRARRFLRIITKQELRQLKRYLTGLAVAATGALVFSTSAGGQGVEKAADAERTRDTKQQVNAEIQQGGGATRVAGSNRYETAVAIADYYGWDAFNTTTVYIASGENYPDALAVGPSTLDDGPLLLVHQDLLPSATAAALAELQPCFIDVIGGPSAISDSVLALLDNYTYPELCLVE
ncbi:MULTISPECIES: cell wall-binding repeat-containing protein [unclassified Ornithinimicrobium]|uniref:cell wall-binding repeat-containing protein n=1 Tax=unclassified Ornithinimicrobium TaxID=2615080 RepID=UPI00385391FA